MRRGHPVLGAGAFVGEGDRRRLPLENLELATGAAGLALGADRGALVERIDIGVLGGHAIDLHRIEDEEGDGQPDAERGCPGDELSPGDAPGLEVLIR